MLNDQERQWIYRHAYLPEHLPDYVATVSDAEPFLCRNHLCFRRKKHLVFIGYPLVPHSETPAQIYDLICERFQPTTVAVIAPTIWLPAERYAQQAPDSYYRLELPLKKIDKSVAYMIRRAQRELQVTCGSFGKKHKKMIKAFMAGHRFDRRLKYIFDHISRYWKASDSAVLLEARKKKELAAFNIVDLGAADYAFYLFNFRSRKLNIPGASDLLFHEMVNLVQAEGKNAVNLGLGINPGIRRFKKKWGGRPFLNYASVTVDHRKVDLGSLAKKL